MLSFNYINFIFIFIIKSDNIFFYFLYKIVFYVLFSVVTLLIIAYVVYVFTVCVNAQTVQLNVYHYVFK